MPRILLSAALVGLLVAAQSRVCTLKLLKRRRPRSLTSSRSNGTRLHLVPGVGCAACQTGTFMMTNQPIMTLVGNASPVPGILLRNIVGLPDWARTENYDVTAKPPAGTPREQFLLMWQAVFATRMKLVAHVEQREATTFALVVARSDGRLGPALKKSVLDCAAQQPPPPGQGPPDFANRCGMGSATAIMSGGMTMDMLARNLSARAGGPVTNRTGLEGNYAFTLRFSPPTGAGAPTNPDDAPDFFTALQEQLGLKLQPEKGTVPYFVIDHIERPTEN